MTDSEIRKIKSLLNPGMSDKSKLSGLVVLKESFQMDYDSIAKFIWDHIGSRQWYWDYNNIIISITRADTTGWVELHKGGKEIDRKYLDNHQMYGEFVEQFNKILKLDGIIRFNYKIFNFSTFSFNSFGYN